MVEHPDPNRVRMRTIIRPAEDSPVRGSLGSPRADAVTADDVRGLLAAGKPSCSRTVRTVSGAPTRPGSVSASSAAPAHCRSPPTAPSSTKPLCARGTGP
ncbi:MAG TPA: hypothetical protein VHR39_11965 [Propionibacteriaceae bacterium]|nr:hypothetical protein [Propionibacteriaceae bacterium]